MKQSLISVLAGCAKRQRESQRQLYEEFYSYGMSITIRYIKDQEQAETVLNDSFLKVFDKIKKFDTDRPFKPWLRQILVNTSIDYLKKKNRLIMKTNLSEAENIAERENILSSLSYKEIIGLVHSLSDAYRTVFNMFVIDGYKHEEIANILGITVGTSKSNLNKARTKLKALITNQLMLQENG